MRKHRINRVWIDRKADDSPDNSTIGKYTDTPDTWAIVLENNAEGVGAGEFLYDLEHQQCPTCKGTGRGGVNTTDGGADDDCCDCEGTGLVPYTCPERGREYRFFMPYAGGEKPGTDDYRKYGLEDFKRMESYNRGHWHYLGIIAKAEIVSPQGVCQTIRSGGLWGVESDSGHEYLAEVEGEELAALKAELTALGIGARAIAHAFAHVQHKDD
jgi:hypothetical protein